MCARETDEETSDGKQEIESGERRLIEDTSDVPRYATAAVLASCLDQRDQVDVCATAC